MARAAGRAAGSLARRTVAAVGAQVARGANSTNATVLAEAVVDVLPYVLLAVFAKGVQATSRQVFLADFGGGGKGLGGAGDGAVVWRWRYIF